jgi:hypothetical protein
MLTFFILFRKRCEFTHKFDSKFAGISFEQTHGF